VKPAAKAPTAKQPSVKTVPAKKVPAKKAAAAKKAQPPATKKTVKGKPSAKTAKQTPVAVEPKAGSALGVSPVMLQKMTDSLRKMGDKRPAKQSSLRRALKPLLGTAASDDAVRVALNNLVARSVVAIGPSGAVTYPQFGKDVEVGSDRP